MFRSSVTALILLAWIATIGFAVLEARRAADRMMVVAEALK